MAAKKTTTKAAKTATKPRSEAEILAAIVGVDVDKLLDLIKASKADDFSEKTKNKENLLLALEACGGYVATACRAVGLARQTFYNYYNEDPLFAIKVDDINEFELDNVETALRTKILAGDITAIIFHLKTKGKKRGYVEKETIADDVVITEVELSLPKTAR